MKVGRLLIGILVANAVGAIGCALVYVAGIRSNSAISFPSLLLIPACMGVAAAWVWSPLGLGLGRTVLHSFTCTLLALVIAAILFREGVICLIILSPVLFAGLLAGALLGRLWFRSNHSRLNLCIAPVLLAVVLAETSLRDRHDAVVTDVIHIAARPEVVWPHVLAFGRIPEPPNFWLFRFGLPYPTETTSGGDFVGADRACRFSGNAVFKERIVEFDPRRRLTFDIIDSPADPELVGHLDAYRGQFELRANADGTTTLVGRTWYSLHVRPAFYFEWWTRHIFGAVHLRVMRNVKQLAEGKP